MLRPVGTGLSRVLFAGLGVLFVAVLVVAAAAAGQSRVPSSSGTSAVAPASPAFVQVPTQLDALQQLMQLAQPRAVHRLATTHLSGGTYNTDQHWTTAGSPYVLDGDVVMASGTTLTIDPGVVVKFNGSTRTLTINGTLSASGTSGSRIYFTSYKDDSVGGDTNGDGSATSPAAGDWSSISFGSGSTGTFSYVTVTYGAQGFAKGDAPYAPFPGRDNQGHTLQTQAGRDFRAFLYWIQNYLNEH
jgi:hypothetical protein